MSEVRSRPSGSRGRGLGRGGRGGHSSRGGGRAGTRQTNGDPSNLVESHKYEDEGEIGELKRMYSSKLVTIKEMFPDWTDEDIVFALQETGGSLEDTIDRISEGNVAQWGEVKKKAKDRSQSKPKEPPVAGGDIVPTSSRGGRGRSQHEGPRGGRGRGSERGRGSGRGARVGLSAYGPRNNGVEKANAETTPATDWGDAPKIDGGASILDQPTESDSAALDSSWENINPSDAVTPQVSEQVKASSKPDGTRSWASMFNKPSPAPGPAKKAHQAPPIQEVPTETPVPAPSKADETGIPGLPPPIPLEVANPEVPNTPPSPGILPSDPPADITPPKDKLTETNLEQVLDTSGPPNSTTAASTVASTLDPRSTAGNETPLHSSQQQLNTRPPLGGYATSAYKATGLPGRSASYQRKILEQQEAVVMPGKHAVDRTAVQFGSMGLNGPAEDLDVDDEREETETRAQPPQHSPIAPRASLPPVPQPQPQPQPATPFSSQPPMTESIPTAPRQAPGLPPVNNAPSMQQPNQHPSADSGVPPQPYNQFANRYGSQQPQQEASAPAQKAYEPFGHQQSQNAYENYNTTSQAQSQPQQTNQSHLGGFSSANDMSSYYTSENQRNLYSNYYGNYQQNSQENTSAQNRVGSAFGTSAPEQAPQTATSQGQPQPQNRYNQTSENQASGSSTPNPTLPSHGQPNPSQHILQQQPHGQSGGQHGGYPYGQPYYASPYYSAYMNQVNNHPYGRERPLFDDVRRYDEHYLTHNPQFGYGGPFGGGASKSGIYGQPHQGYGISPQTSYDQHSSSPAIGGFGQQHSAQNREGASSGGVSNYNRSGSTQPSEPQQQYSTGGTGGYGNMPDVFGRNQAGYQTQSQGLGNQQTGQQGSSEDSLRGFGDSKTTGGPSPAAGARPGSAANSLQNQAGFPPPQGQSQQGFGGYPTHLSHQMHGQQASQYGTGPAGGHHGSGAQSHQTGGYGTYGGGFGGNYYGNNARGGWGGNYGH
ncbi:MAG: hypothetical protein LQ342_000028 [Letrouitia transgressa]|nr:MAG: hypothetical protein LQ342_000028 [Letrouitia transgressa]